MNITKYKLTVGATAILLILTFGAAILAQIPAESEIQKKTEQAYTIYNDAFALFKQGTAQSDHAALIKFQEASRLYREINYKSYNAWSALWTSGRISDRLGEKSIALKYYDQALPLARAVGLKSLEAATLNNIGLVYSSLGEKQKALEYYAQALPLGIDSGKAATLSNIGGVYLSLGEKQKALNYLAQALSLYKAIGIEWGEAETLSSIGGVYLSLGELQKALDYYNQALPPIKAVGYKSGEATILTSIGVVYVSLGEKQKALEYFQASLPLRKVVGDKSGQAYTLFWLMYHWQSLNNPRFAVFYGKQSVNLLQELRTNIQSLDKETQKTYLKSVEPTYRRLADILIAQGCIAEAEQVLGMLKEEEYFSYLRRDDKVAADLKGRISLSPDEKIAFADYEKFADDITRAAQEFGALEKKKNDLPLGASLSADEQKQYRTCLQLKT